MLLPAVAGIASGCGEPGQQGTPARIPDKGATRAVRAYVDALDRRDRAEFCRVLAPWVRARVGAAIKDGFSATASTPDADLCEKGASFIGFYGENSETRWAGAEIEDLSAPRLEGSLTVVDLRIRNHYAGTPYTSSSEPRADRVQRDRVYLVDVGGEWRIAKLSAVADTASVGFVDRTDPLDPPDIAAEQSWYRERAEKAGEASANNRDTAGHDYNGCAGIGGTRSVQDTEGDIEPKVIIAGRRRSPSLPGVDLRRVSVARSDDTLCFDFETAGPIEAPIAMIVHIREPGRLGAEGFALHTILNTPGEAVVTLRSPGADDGAIDGEVAVRGNRMSVRIGRDQFPTGMGRLFDRFGWTAQSIYHGDEATRHRVSQFDDTVPEYGRTSPQYP